MSSTTTLSAPPKDLQPREPQATGSQYQQQGDEGSGLLNLVRLLHAHSEQASMLLDQVSRAYDVFDSILSPQQPGKPYRIVLHRKSRVSAHISQIITKMKQGEQVHQQIQELQGVHPETAQAVNALFASEASFMSLRELVGSLRGAPREAAQALKERGTVFSEAIKAGYGKRKADRFDLLGVRVLDDEPEYLETLKVDIESWGEKLKRYDDRIHTEVVSWWVRAYIQGNESTKGIRAYNDQELFKRIKEKMQVQELLRYQEQLVFVRGMLQAMQKTKGVERENWQEAMDIWRHVPRYIIRVRKYFGNEDLALSLEKFSKKVHDEPAKWELELQERLRELYDPQYQQRFIIHKVEEELIEAFRIRAQEKAEEREQNTKNLLRFIESLHQMTKKRIAGSLNRLQEKLREDAHKELFDHQKRLEKAYQGIKDSLVALEVADQKVGRFGSWVANIGPLWGRHRIYQMQVVSPLANRWDAGIQAWEAGSPEKGRIMSFFLGMRGLHSSINTTMGIENNVTSPQVDPKFQRLFDLYVLPRLNEETRKVAELVTGILPAYLFTFQELMDHEPESLLRWKMIKRGDGNGR